jgi:hypothetical protein
VQKWSGQAKTHDCYAVCVFIGLLVTINVCVCISVNNKVISDKNKVMSITVSKNEQISTLSWPEINALLANQNNHKFNDEQPC